MISPITYRAQDESDAAFLRRLFAGVLDATLGLEAWPEREREFTLRLQYDARERGWAERHPPGQLDIIEVDGVRAGRIRLSQPEAEASRRVVDLAVLPEFRRRGLASAALTRHRAALHLNVSRTNLPAQQLYGRNGFTLYGGDELDLYLHRPPLRASPRRPFDLLSTPQ
ncbi:GNAT family N-acetyltransferase [Streptomyces sp. NPDC001635]